MAGQVADAGVRYNHEHRAVRAYWAKRLGRGEFVECARCGLVVLAAWPPPPGVWAPAEHVPTCTGRGVKRGEPCRGECWARWELGHVEGGGPKDYSGPEHLHCNRKAGGLNGARVAHATKVAKREQQRAAASRREHVSRKP